MKIEIVADNVFMIHDYEDAGELQDMLYVNFEPQLFEAFDEFMDASEEPVKIAGYTFDVSHALKCSDAIAYREEMLNWLDSMTRNIFEELEHGEEIYVGSLTFLLAEEKAKTYTILFTYEGEIFGVDLIENNTDDFYKDIEEQRPDLYDLIDDKTALQVCGRPTDIVHTKYIRIENYEDIKNYMEARK